MKTYVKAILHDEEWFPVTTPYTDPSEWCSWRMSPVMIDADLIAKWNRIANEFTDVQQELREAYERGNS